ncbi:MAG: hypothetical protein COV73_06210 [Candidatus Omnitrophica bacterium CG11_big_fil_rev_8_21_14_0_20_43_6]|nr:MAG: hypothetical protein COV73_06210 [Candidatus Omnitrophica bacterium CG11_big_fil_rev_8_21_14_0_20_43_6]
MKKGYFYIGNKIYDGNKVGLIFVFKISDKNLLKLSRLIYVAKNNSILVVFTPLSNSEKSVFKKHLKTDETVRKYFDTEACRLLENIISGLLRPEIGVDLVIRQLSKEQEEDYKNFEYKCYDKIHIPGNSSMKRSNEIEINSHKVRLGDSMFRLFLRLVLELKKKRGGWVSRHTLDAEGIITDVDKFQIYSNLRMSIQGSLLDKDGQKFIENNGSKQYRISLHPDFITYHKEKLLKHHDNSIQELARKLTPA